MSVRARIVFVGVGIVAVTCVCTLSLSYELFAVRVVPVEIRLDGKVILEGSANDDGSRDADELWRFLPEVKFRPTEEGEKWVALADTERRLLKGHVTITVAHGGSADLSEFIKTEVIRTTNKDGQFDWKVDTTFVDHYFSGRHIPRSAVRYLKDRKASK